MKRVLLVCAAAVVASGCTFGVKPCTTRDQCESGAQCLEGLCVLPEDAGASGGGGGMLGGGQGGGGGSMGGGGGTVGGGGGTLTCTGCQDWQTCNGNTGQCADVTVKITTPMANSEFGENTAVPVVAEVKDFAGQHVVRTRIPGTATNGVVLTGGVLQAIDAGIFVGDYQLPSGAGAYSLTAGWDGGARDTIAVTGQACMVMCKDWEECVPSGTGGSCSNLGLTLTWVLPVDGGTFGLDASVALDLQVTTSGGRPFAKTVPVTLDNVRLADLTKNVTWQGMANSGGAEAMRTLVAGWQDGGPVSMPRQFHVDGTKPNLAVTVSGTAPYQRDGVAWALVEGNEAIGQATVTLGDAGAVPGTLFDCQDAGVSGDGGGQCFKLDFSAPGFDAFAASMGVVASAADVFGNVSVADGGQLAVTRLRWTRTVGSGVPQTLVVAPDGTLIVGTSTVVERIDPRFGSLDASVALGDVQSLAVDPGRLYVAYNAPRGFLSSADVQTLAADPGNCFGASAGSLIKQAIALNRPDGGEVFSIGSFITGTGTDGKGCLYAPSAGGVYFAVGTGALDSAVTTPGTNVVIHNNIASFLVQDQGASPGAYFQPVGLASGTPTLGTRAQLTVAGSNPAFGQSVVSDEFLISTTSTGGGSNQLFMRGGTNDTQGNLGAASDKGVVAVASSTEAYLGFTNSFGSIVPGALGSVTPVASLGGTDTVRSSPVLGALRPGAPSALGYAISRSGQLLAFTHSAGGSAEQWRYSMPSASYLVHPTFDCNRQNATSKTGVLYIAGADGKIYAVVVDSPKLLEGIGVWPKFQRTQGNAGNTSSAFPINWPACQ